MHTPRRVLVTYIVTLAYLIFVVAVSSHNAPLFIALFALYGAGCIGYGGWRTSRTMTAAGVQKRLQRAGDEVQVRIGYQGWSLKAWDPSHPLGPRNGVRGTGFGSYRLNESGEVTLTWHPVGGSVRQLTGPRVESSRGTGNARRARPVLVSVLVLYVAILGGVGLAAGLLTGSAVIGLLAVGVTVCILPIIATALRTARTRPTNRRQQHG